MSQSAWHALNFRTEMNSRTRRSNCRKAKLINSSGDTVTRKRRRVKRESFIESHDCFFTGERRPFKFIGTELGGTYDSRDEGWNRESGLVWVLEFERAE